MADPSERTTPPENPAEWAYLWTSAQKAHDGWIVTGPVIAIVKNWKPWAAAMAFFLWINQPEIFRAISVVLGEK